MQPTALRRFRISSYRLLLGIKNLAKKKLFDIKHDNGDSNDDNGDSDDDNGGDNGDSNDDFDVDVDDVNVDDVSRNDGLRFN